MPPGRPRWGAGSMANPKLARSLATKSAPDSRCPLSARVRTHLGLAGSCTTTRRRLDLTPIYWHTSALLDWIGWDWIGGPALRVGHPQLGRSILPDWIACFFACPGDAISRHGTSCTTFPWKVHTRRVSTCMIPKD